MPNQEDESLTLTIPEAAKLLRISRATAYEAARTGALPVLRFGRVLRVPKFGLQRLLGEQGENLKDKGEDEH